MIQIGQASGIGQNVRKTTRPGAWPTPYEQIAFNPSLLPNCHSQTGAVRLFAGCLMALLFLCAARAEGAVQIQQRGAATG